MTDLYTEQRKADDIWRKSPRKASHYAGGKFWMYCPIYKGWMVWAGVNWEEYVGSETPSDFEDYCKRPQPTTEPPQIEQEAVKAYSAPDYLAKGLAILSERGKQYGSNDKERSFPQVAAAFNAITGHNITSADVCLMLAVLKMVRQNAQRDRVHEDSLVDCVNYAALWAQELNKRNGVTDVKA